ncbi:hypothetical protein MKY95_21050 [Paenibacillus sp. FSL P4-0176]|uniref:hypothetical protein n=1 Tax=Paenibacillus sp. FSL P4-0176 TaxID=2921631 RepID=UPI0030D31C79
MIKPIAQQPKATNDGSTPHGLISDELYLVDELSVYLMDKYHAKQQIKTMGYSQVKALKVQVSEEVRRANPALMYGNADALSSIINGGDTNDQTGEA